MAKTLQELGQTEISELVDKGINVFTPDDTISRVLGELQKKGHYEALVSTGNKIGLVTIRDLLNIDQPEQTKIEKIWSPLTPVTSDNTIMRVSAELVRINVRALPVIENNKPVGIISQVDIVESLHECQELKKIPVRTLIKSPPTALDIGEKVAQARKIMLDKGFSHIPITKEDKLAGLVTAQDIVYAFTTTIGRSRIGERPGEKVTKFPGLVNGIMDKTPLTLGLESNALDVVQGIRDHKKSACLIIDNQNRLHGIITPKELLPLISETTGSPELPVYIVGLTSEDFFEKSVAEEKIRRVISKRAKTIPEINEVSIKIKKQSPRGERVRYQMTARVLSPTNQYNANAEGWDLLETFDKLIDSLDSSLRRAKKEPFKVQRRGRGRS